jgi:hypothetical protein
MPSRALLLIRVVVTSALVSALLGGVYGYTAHGAFGTGAVVGAVCGAIFSALEGFGFQGDAGDRLRRRPFLVYFGVRCAVYVVLIVMIEALGVWLLRGRQGLADFGLLDIAFGLALSVIGNLMYSIADLLGPGVLFAFAAGRYPTGQGARSARFCSSISARRQPPPSALARRAFSTCLTPSSSTSRKRSCRTAARFTNMSETRSLPPGG